MNQHSLHMQELYHLWNLPEQQAIAVENHEVEQQVCFPLVPHCSSKFEEFDQGNQQAYCSSLRLHQQK